MSRKLYYETLRYQVQDQKDKDNGNNNTRQWRNQKGTRQDKSRRLIRLYSTLYTSIQQEEAQKVTGET